MHRIDKALSSINIFLNNNNNNNNNSNNNNSNNIKLNAICNSLLIAFKSSMNDDLNTPKAVSVLFELIEIIEKEVSLGTIDECSANILSNTFKKMDNVFGFAYTIGKDFSEGLLTESLPQLLQLEDIPDSIKKLIENRLNFKRNKLYKQADEIRDALFKMGFDIKDNSEGSLNVYKI